MKNFSKTSVVESRRVELHDKLSLTGAEISINTLEAETGFPFAHYHKKNEEIYGIIAGKGKVIIDGETVELTRGDWLRIAPSAKRQFFAANDSPISYICIQAKENSLEEYTQDDGVMA